MKSENVRAAVFTAAPDGVDGVMVRLYPGTDISVEMRIDAAIHLLRLVERYIWAVSDEARYTDRWRKFWRGVTIMERTMVVLCVRTHCRGEFSARHGMHIGSLPPALESYQGNRRTVPMSVEVRREFRALLHVFYSAILSTAEVSAVWRERLADNPEKKVVALVAGLGRWLGNSTDDDLDVVLRDCLTSEGVEHGEAEQLAYRLADDVRYCIQEKEDALYGQARRRKVGPVIGESSTLH